jgi:hypothetical protein
MKYTYTLLFPAFAAAVGVNPDPNFNPAKSNGDFGPFTPVRVPAPGATGAPKSVNAQQAKALQSASDNWSSDTGTVSHFQDIGKSTAAGQSFNSAANTAFLAEVDELTHKAILDQIIGNDPQVSIANLTLTNGVFQSVVNNLQIMSVQGKGKQNLIDTINSVRCTQILPSIDTYLAVAARVIGPGATLRKAIRPAACAGILAQNANNPAAFPNVPNVPGGTPLGQQAPGSGASTNTGTHGGGAGAGNGGNAASSAASPSSTSASVGRKGTKTKSSAAANTPASNAGAGGNAGSGAGNGAASSASDNNAGAGGNAASSAANSLPTSASVGRKGTKTKSNAAANTPTANAGAGGNAGSGAGSAASSSAAGNYAAAASSAAGNNAAAASSAAGNYAAASSSAAGNYAAASSAAASSSAAGWSAPSSSAAAATPGKKGKKSKTSRSFRS